METNLIAQVKVADWKPGDVIESRYELVSRIGLGGMGVVWKVLHREWNRELALKVPLPELVGSVGLKERFVREAETWVGLGVHPHIVQCWYVLAISGLPCLFLDYLPGGSLKDRIGDSRISPGNWREILKIAMGVASGLVHSHARGVVHRDIKPENLLFRPDGRVCVTDFGLVKTALAEDIKEIEHSISSEEPSLSGAGAYLGTPQYGAPEQWGAAEKVTPAADIYAFGVTLYEMCAGRRPFDVEGDTSVTVYDLINAHLKTTPPDPREFYPNIPIELALLCSACLEKDPISRPPSMTAILEALSSFYTSFCGEHFPKVIALPNAQNPDIQNNSAVSLLSLGKIEQAKAAWRLGLRQDPIHRECIYNLTQQERKEGSIGTQEALRRLQQAKANYPLALLCIEQGLYKEAVTVLSENKSEKSVEKGLVQRALGDANMYLHQFFKAETAYRQALKFMPNDDYSNKRRVIASRGLRGIGEDIEFPLREQRFRSSIKDGTLVASINDDSTEITLVGASKFFTLESAEGIVIRTLARASSARPAEKIWSWQSRMLIQEQGAFQLRMLPDLKLIGRKGGKVLAATADLARMVFLTREGPMLFTFDLGTFEPITGSSLEDNFASMLAAFDKSGSQLCLLLPTGELGQIDSEFQVATFSWPGATEQLEEPTALALASSGLVFIGYGCGTIRCFDVINRDILYDIKLPAPICELELSEGDHCLLVDLQKAKVLLNEKGEVVWQGPSPAILVADERYLLAFVRGALTLYCCSPFYFIRRWEASSDECVYLASSNRGGLAVSISSSGVVEAWEVFEDSRAYERSPLLSISQSYDELVWGAQAFPEAMAASREFLEDGNLIESYKELRTARSVAGYGQNPQALDLNWQIISKMGRDSVDAVWDRLTIAGKNIEAVDISLSGDKILLVVDGLVTLRSETASDSRLLWEHKAGSLVIEAKIVGDSVLLAEKSGRVMLLSLDNGSVREEFHLTATQIRDVYYDGSSLVYATTSAEVGRYDLKTHKTVALTPPIEQDMLSVFPWIDNFVIGVSKEQFGVVELGKKNAKAIVPFSSKSYQPESEISFGHIDHHHKVLILGTEDGLIAITDIDTGRLRYAIGKVSGAVTGFVLISELALGVITTARGHLYFWDLRADKLLEGLLAHRGGVKSLSVDKIGRYLVTSGKDGTARLWEVSWTASLSIDKPGELEWLPKENKPSGGFWGRLFKTS